MSAAGTTTSETAGGSASPAGKSRPGASRYAAALVSFVGRRWPELVVAACAIALYLPAAHFGFVFDDTSLIGPGGEPRAVGGAIPYRPLRYASYLLDFGLGGSPAVYHLNNVALHAFVAALTAAVARRLGASRIAALAGGLLVALHPIAVEAAAYVSGRRDLLCVAFGLGALLAQLHRRTRAACALLVASVASKESGLVFAMPLFAAIVTRASDHANASDANLPARIERAALARLAVASAAAAAFVVAYGAVGPWLPGAGLASFAHAGTVLLHYASGLAGAHSLSPDYPALVATTPSLLPVLVAAFAATAIAAAVRTCGQAATSGEDREQAFVLAWIASVVSALAVWGGVHEPGADRHAYLLLPPLGVGLALLASYIRVDAAARVAVAACGVGLALVAAASTRGQMEIWRSDRTLWSHAVAQADASPRAHANMARVAAADGDLALAQSQLAEALTKGGNDPLLLASRAALRCARGRRPLAARDLRRARSAEPALVASIARDCGLPAAIRLRPAQLRAQPVEASGK